MTQDPAQLWRAKLRAQLLTARKDRDQTRTSALRTALAAIDNAETPDGARVDAPTSDEIAGGVVGLGAAEVARRQLSDEQIRALLRTEVDERISAADDFSAGGHSQRARSLHDEAAVLLGLLGDV